MKENLIEAVSNLDERNTLRIVKQLLKKNTPPIDIIRLAQEGVALVGEKYSFGTYFLSDLIISSEILKEIFALISPYIDLEKNSRSFNNKEEIIIGTIHGDIHDLGKNIVIFTLRSAGYIVHDLGVDVPQEVFIKRIQETRAKIIGVSVLLNHCFNEIKKLNDLLISSGLRKRIKLIVGGYAVNKAFMEFVGADYYSNDALEALYLINHINKNLKN